MTIDWTYLEKTVTDVCDRASPAVCVAVPGEPSWAYQGDKPVPAASTAKIAVMVEVYRRIDQGALTLDTPFSLTNADRVPGSGVLWALHEGLTLTTGDLLYLMMSISDNVATNALIRSVGMDAVNRTMRELGLKHSILGRLMVGRLARPDEQENLATAEDYIRLIDTIITGTAASAPSCAAMLDLLSSQQNHRRLGRVVPTAPGYRWGSKNGTNRGIVNEVGFVRNPTRTLLVAIYLQEVESEVLGEALVAEIAAAALKCAGMASG